MINNHFVIEHTYQGLVMAYHDKLMMKRPIETGLHFDPRSGALVLNGRHGHLQFFNVKNEEQLYQVLQLLCSWVTDVLVPDHIHV